MKELDTAAELAVQLFADEEALTTWFCSPGETEELATGWLVGEGIVPAVSSIRSLDVSDAETVRVTLSSTDEGGSFAARPAADLDAWIADGTVIRPLFDLMFDRSPSRRGSGGVHTGALVVDGELCHVSEDVSRHCLVDKLIGRALRERYPMPETVILLSARISAAIAGKACRSGLGAIASMSIPTTPAAELAAACGVILVGRSRRSSPQVHRPGS